MNRLKVLIGLAVAAVVGLALAASVDVENTLYRAQYTVNADGTYTLVVEYRKKPLTQAGVEQVGQASMYYSESMQELSVEEAYTLKADGTKIPVPEDKIYTQSPPETQDAPTFSDNKVVKVVFPKVGVGDETYVRWKIVQKKPYFPGRFYATDLEPIDQVFKKVEIVINAPASISLQWEKRGNELVGDYRVEEETKDGRKIIKAGFSRSKPLALEPGMVDDRQVDPVLTVTNFASWEEIGKAYWERAADKAQVTDAIREKANEIAGSASGLEAAQLLYNWVAANIRYVALNFGIGGYVPQAAEEVLEQGYGDCKGYVTLLQALLAAKDIQSEPVLIYSGEDYGLLPAPTPEQFNHAIIYLPQYGVYLDPTMRYAPFGVLPLGDLSKPVVIAGSRSRLDRTPSGNPSRDRYREEQTITLTEEGSLEGSATITFKGYPEAEWRLVMAGIPEAAYPQVVQALLAQFAEGGSGSMKTTSPENLGVPFQVTASWKSPSVSPAGDRMTLGQVPVGFSLLPLAQLRAYAAPESRNFPVAPGAFDAEYHKELVYPSDYQLVLLPQGVSFENAAGSFEANFSDEGGKIRIELDLKIVKDVYQPDEYPDLKALIQKAVASVTQPFVFEKR